METEDQASGGPRHCAAKAAMAEKFAGDVICEYPSRAVGDSETEIFCPAEIGACSRLQITQLAESCTGFTGIRFNGIFEFRFGGGGAVAAHSRSASAR